MNRHTIKYLNSPAINVMLPDGINVTIDPVADVIYIKVCNAEIVRSKVEKDGILVDLDRNNNLVGISIVHPKKVSLERRAIFKKIASRFHTPGVERIRPDHLARGYAYA